MFGERQRAPDINPGSCPPKKYIKKASHRSSPFCILLFLRVLLKQKPQNLRQADPAAFPFSSGVHPWPTGSAILYPPLVTRALGIEPAEPSSSAELLHPSTGSISGFVFLALLPTNSPLLTCLHRRTEVTSWSRESEGLSWGWAFPCHFSHDSLSVPFTYQLTQSVC